MASLIRLKQIESSSQLASAAGVGADFSASVIEIVSQSIVGVLPDGVVTSSAQIELLSASGYGQFTQSLNETLATDIELAVVSGAVATTIGILSSSFVTTASFNSYTQSFSSSIHLELSSSAANVTSISSSLDNRVDALEQFSSSLDQTYATDAEVEYTASNIIDQGEW